MMLVETAPIAAAVLPVAQFKDHLRLGRGFSNDAFQDDLLEGFLRAALAAVEARTSKALLQRAFSWKRELASAVARLELPIAPVRVVDAVGYEGEAPLAASAWRFVPDAQCPVIEASGVFGIGSLQVQFQAGFGPTWADVPADLAQAVMLLAAHYYEFRHETALGGGCMPFGVSALIEPHRAVRLSGARA